MRNAVLHVLRSVGLEPEAPIPTGEVGLRVQDHRTPDAELEGAVHQVPGQTVTACVPTGADTADPSYLPVVEHAQIRGRTGLPHRPDVPGQRLGVTSVQLRVGALLLDDEDVDPQADQIVQIVRAQLSETGGVHSRCAHPASVAHRCGDNGGMPRTIATNTQVGRAELLDFVRPRHHHILTTHRRDGSPQLSPVTAGVDAQGRIVISTYPDRAKANNLRRHGACSVLVLSDDFGGAWVQVDGTAEVIDLPDSVEPLVDYFRSISGEHPDWDEYRQAMVDQGKSLIRITLTRWGPVATGGFPPRLA